MTAADRFAPVETAVGEPLVELTDLRTYYDTGGLFGGPPVQAVDGVSLDIRRGETLGLVGESGCGKTTLGRTLARYEMPTDGRIVFDGTDVTTLNEKDDRAWRRHCQMVFQDPDSSLDDRMTVGEVVGEPLDVHDWEDSRTRRHRVLSLLERVGLDPDHYYRYPHQFSGGQRQRIAIARALALEPDVLVLDEPVSALDVSVQAQILDLLRDLQAQFDLTYLFIAHDLSVVRQICDRVAVMYLGNLMELGPTEALFDTPQNPYTRALLSAVPEPDPTADWNHVTLHGQPPNPRYPPDGCPFTTRCQMKIRPDDVSFPQEVWDRLEVFQSVLRTRATEAQPLSRRVRALLGRHHEDDLATVREALFDEGDIETVPPAAAQALDDAVATAERQDPEAAVELLRDRFPSPCDERNPALSADGSTHRSRCHRHESAYSSPEEVAASRRQDEHPTGVTADPDD